MPKIQSNQFKFLLNHRSSSNDLFWLLVGIVLTVGVATMSYTFTSLEQGRNFVRLWTILSVGVCAIVPPHVLFPDRNITILQLFNPPPKSLYVYQLRQLTPLCMVLLFPQIVAFQKLLPSFFIDSLLYLISSFLLLLTVMLVAFTQFGTLGKTSQLWQERKKGDWYRKYKENINYGFAVPEGLAPAMFLTPRISLLGIFLVVLNLILESNWGTYLSLLLNGFCFGFAFLKSYKTLSSYDVFFYQTNGYYREIFNNPQVRISSARDPLTFDSLYWVPSKLRPAVWLHCIQFDRILPLGRFIFLAILILWIVAIRIQDASLFVVLVSLILLAKNATIFLQANNNFSPAPFQNHWYPPSQWIVIRTFLNLRWTLPIFLGILPLFGLVSSFSVQLLFVSFLIDILIAGLFAFFATWSIEFSQQKKYG